MKFYPSSQQPVTENEPPLSEKLARAEARISERLAEERESQSTARPPQGVERLFGRPGAVQRYLAPLHLLHTLPPGYPLSLAIGSLLSFRHELENHLQEELGKKDQLETVIRDYQPLLFQLKANFQQLQLKQKRAIFKSRLQKELDALTEEIFRTINRARIKDSLPPQGSCPARAVDNFLFGTNLSLGNCRTQIEEITYNLQLFKNRTAELIEQYFDELTRIPEPELSAQLALPGQAQLHARIVREKEDLDLPVPL